MKIIHYSLGFPPYRSGGMTKFCTDLMIQQLKQGHDVGLLWPGRKSLWNHKVKILKEQDMYGIHNYEIKNPLPISLNGGIKDISWYTEECKNPEAFEWFLEEQKPDVVHIHTLMGIHKEFLTIAKEKGIRLVYTTHDYFGICPKLTMFRNGAVCDNVEQCEYCPQCNEKALNRKKIFVLQSPIYRKFKDVFWVKKIRGKFRTKFFRENDAGQQQDNKTQVLEYINLRKYYVGMLEQMDQIHFNSQLTREVFARYTPQLVEKGTVAVISHNDIKDRRKEFEPGGKIRLGFASLHLESKGFPMLVEVLDELWEEGNHWFELHLFGKRIRKRSYVVQHERFQYDELETAYRNMDVLIMPSIWKETFGLVVLEALSFGVPVVITENVGSKELIENGRYGLITKVDKESLKEAIRSLKDGQLIREFNRNIVKEPSFGIKDYLENIEKMYR